MKVVNWARVSSREQQEKIKAILSRKLDRVCRNMRDAFKAKSAALKVDTACVTEEIDAQGDVDPTRSKTVLDWSQKAAEISRGSNTTTRRQILDSICLNRQVNDVTLVTTKRKPFEFFVERLDLKKSRSLCF